MNIVYRTKIVTTSENLSSTHNDHTHCYNEVRHHFKEYTRYSIVLQPNVYHLHNVGYTRALTYIKETDFEI